MNGEHAGRRALHVLFLAEDSQSLLETKLLPNLTLSSPKDVFYYNILSS